MLLSVLVKALKPSHIVQRHVGVCNGPRRFVVLDAGLEGALFHLGVLQTLLVILLLLFGFSLNVLLAFSTFAFGHELTSLVDGGTVSGAFHFFELAGVVLQSYRVDMSGYLVYFRVKAALGIGLCLYLAQPICLFD